MGREVNLQYENVKQALFMKRKSIGAANTDHSEVLTAILIPFTCPTKFVLQLTSLPLEPSQPNTLHLSLPEMLPPWEPLYLII